MSSPPAAQRGSGAAAMRERGLVDRLVSGLDVDLRRRRGRPARGDPHARDVTRRMLTVQVGHVAGGLQACKPLRIRPLRTALTAVQDRRSPPCRTDAHRRAGLAVATRELAGTRPTGDPCPRRTATVRSRAGARDPRDAARRAHAREPRSRVSAARASRSHRRGRGGREPGAALAAARRRAPQDASTIPIQDRPARRRAASSRSPAPGPGA